MVFAELLGRVAKMWVRRRGPHGASLVTAPDAPDDAPVLLLPRREVPADVADGGALEVFVYLDSEDRPTATLLRPRVMLGEVAFLACTDLAPFGAFFDWGLSKDLLVSKWEQLRPVRLQERVPIGLVKDDSGRLAGTMRISELFAAPPARAVGDWVDGEVWRIEHGLGAFVILEKRYVGLVPAAEPMMLSPGDAARFRVAAVLRDGKLELSARARAHEQLDDDGRVILEALARPNPPKLGDDSSPEHLRATLGLSKKAFKRALGRLLKDGVVTVGPDGFIALS